MFIEKYNHISWMASDNYAIKNNTMRIIEYENLILDVTTELLIKTKYGLGTFD